jgi:hypothetical protein
MTISGPVPKRYTVVESATRTHEVETRLGQPWQVANLHAECLRHFRRCGLATCFGIEQLADESSSVLKYAAFGGGKATSSLAGLASPPGL